MDKFEFLKSNRFWALVIGAMTIYLKGKGYIGEPETLLIATVMAGFVTLRTVDRVAEKIGGSDVPTLTVSTPAGSSSTATLDNTNQ